MTLMPCPDCGAPFPAEVANLHQFLGAYLAAEHGPKTVAAFQRLPGCPSVCGSTAGVWMSFGLVLWHVAPSVGWQYVLELVTEAERRLNAGVVGKWQRMPLVVLDELWESGRDSAFAEQLCMT
jgi:hypothetical protein